VAGDWLKMTHALPEKPEVLAIAGRTGMSRFEVVGRLFILWRWFDNNTTDGNALSVTSVTLNECLFGYQGDTNFVSEVVSARWLVETGDGISVVKFDEHISESAKQRAQTAKRVAKSKSNAKGNAPSVSEVTLPALPSALPREEKRREEKEDRAASPSFVLPDWIPAEAWAGYVEMRSKKKGGAMTVRARNLKVAELKKFKDAGHDLGAILDKSTANGWTDIYEPKGDPSAKQESFV
jgi:chorismate mutase